MLLECLKNNSKILSDVLIMQFGKGVLHCDELIEHKSYITVNGRLELVVPVTTKRDASWLRTLQIFGAEKKCLEAKNRLNLV